MFETQNNHLPLIAILLVALATSFATSLAAEDKAAEENAARQYETQIKPLFQKHCAACHNDDDLEGGFSVDSYQSVLNGAESGKAIVPGDSKSSLLARAITGQTDSLMPPEDEGKMAQQEIQTILDWIDAGADGPQGAEERYTSLNVPSIVPQHNRRQPVTDVEWSPTADLIAVARFRKVELLNPNDMSVVHTLDGHDGKVNRVVFSSDGSRLLTGSGITGLKGTLRVFSTADGSLQQTIDAHDDAMYGVAINHDGSQVATSSYDHSIVLHDIVTGKSLREFTEHNGAVYDIDFNRDSKSLVSASGDETLKVWSVASGQRLDTLGQPLEEQFVARFSPDDRFIAGAGRDNRIRIWRFMPSDVPKTSPLRFSRFAHEQPIVDLAFSSDSKLLVSVSEDRSIKVWETQTFDLLQALTDQPSICNSVSIDPDGKRMVVGRLDGSVEVLKLDPIRKIEQDQPKRGMQAADRQSPAEDTGKNAKTEKVAEVEPNDTADAAQAVSVPTTLTGVIHSRDAADVDQDLFRFEAKSGELFVLETNAQRMKSPLDTVVQVLDDTGKPVPQVRLRAVRDSYFTFRGKDSNTSDDFRLHNWEEMELNQFLYANGEVVKLWHYPRGPDSGFRVYPGRGNRWSYFGTTPFAHALQSPCFVVEPIALDEDVAPNGLPEFLIHYENDDEAMRRLGSDSQLLFTAPSDGTFIASIRDVRGFEGEKFEYEFTIRRAAPDYKVTLNDLPRTKKKDKDGKEVSADAVLNVGSPREFKLNIDRIDGFIGPVRVDISGMPAGFHVTSPLILEREQTQAMGLIYADPEAKQPDADAFKETKIVASAMIAGREVRHEVGRFGGITIQDKSRLLLRITGSDGTAEMAMATTFDKPVEISIHPGETVSAKVFAERRNFDQLINFGKDESGHNMPHGVFVDNIGLNGLMILADQNERTFYITAAITAEPQTRTFHLRGNNADGECSLPVRLTVLSGN